MVITNLYVEKIWLDWKVLFMVDLNVPYSVLQMLVNSMSYVQSCQTRCVHQANDVIKE